MKEEVSGVEAVNMDILEEMDFGDVVEETREFGFPVQPDNPPSYGWAR